MLCRWCTSNLKNRVIDNYLKRYKEELLKQQEKQTNRQEAINMFKAMGIF